MSNKKYFQQLAKNLYFEMHDDELDKLVKEFDNLSKKINSLSAIDIKNVQATDYPIDISCNTLREDVYKETKQKKDCLKNANKIYKNFVEVK